MTSAAFLSEGTFVRIRRTNGLVPPLLRGHYAEVLGKTWNDTTQRWDYTVRVYAWIWKPTLTLSGNFMQAVAPEFGARRSYLDRQNEVFAELEEAVEAFRTALVHFAETLNASKEQTLRGFDQVWLADNATHAARLVASDAWPKDREPEVTAAWKQLLLDSRDVVRWTERALTDL